jgi:DNA-binding transcriptional regulator YdaS (Cro superfamily)
MGLTPAEIICQLISKYGSMREFARFVAEDSTDIMRWKTGKRTITPRAVIKICRKHPEILPFELNPDVFPTDLDFNFRK